MVLSTAMSDLQILARSLREVTNLDRLIAWHVIVKAKPKALLVQCAIIFKLLKIKRGGSD